MALELEHLGKWIRKTRIFLKYDAGEGWISVGPTV